MSAVRIILNILYGLSAIAALCIAGILIWNKPLPEGREGPEAEALADSIAFSIGCEEWQRLRFLAWTFDERREYVWDKLYNLAEVCYGETRVLLNLNTIDGIVWHGGVRVSREKKRRDILKAWEYWRRDAFWVNAPCQVQDTGAIRKIVALPDSTRGLLVTYLQDGAMPGDSYLWVMDQFYRPRYWRMWVRNLPVRGLRLTWENWQMVGDVQMSSLHRIGPYQIRIQDLRTGRHFSELGLSMDPFTDFVTE